MWPSTLTQNSHRYTSLQYVERQVPVMCFVRVATIDAAEIALLLSPMTEFDPFPTVDGVRTQPGDVILFLDTEQVGHFVTVGDGTGTPTEKPVPLRTIVMIQEGTVHRHALFVRGDGCVTMQVSGALFSDSDNPDPDTGGVSLVSRNNTVRGLVSHNRSVTLCVDATDTMVDLATAVYTDAVLPTVDDTWTLQYENGTGDFIVHLRTSGVAKAVSLTDSGPQNVVVPFGYNDVEWTIGQFLVNTNINVCLLIADDAGSYVPSLQFVIPDTVGPHVGEALVMVRGCPPSVQQSGFTLSFTIQLHNVAPVSFWVGIDCLDAFGEMHNELWSDPATPPLPSHSHYSGTLTVPVGGGLKSVYVTNWHTNSYLGTPRPTITAIDHSVYPKFEAAVNCQVIVLRMGISEPSDLKAHIVSGQVEFMKSLLS